MDRDLPVSDSLFQALLVEWVIEFTSRVAIRCHVTHNGVGVQDKKRKSVEIHLFVKPQEGGASGWITYRAQYPMGITDERVSICTFSGDEAGQEMLGAHMVKLFQEWTKNRPDWIVVSDIVCTESMGREGSAVMVWPKKLVFLTHLNRFHAILGQKWDWCNHVDPRNDEREVLKTAHARLGGAIKQVTEKWEEALETLAELE